MMPISSPTTINDSIKGFIPQKEVKKEYKINLKEHSFLTEIEHRGKHAG